MRLPVLAATGYVLVLCLLTPACGTKVTEAPNPPVVNFKPQPFQPPENCLPCHQRQFDELRSAVKSGYRNVSPLFNGLAPSLIYIELHAHWDTRTTDPG